MKKEERLHRLFGDIDDALVAEAARRPVRKTVWMPIVAAAACVALSVGLWQGGVFDPESLPVEAPTEGTTTDGTADTTTTTAKPTTTTTAKPTTKTEPTDTITTAKPTTTTTEPYILVGGEDDLTSLDKDCDPNYPRLKDRLVSPALEEKMKEYRDVNAVFQVGVMSAFTIEDDNEISNFLKTDEEYQSLIEQYHSASEACKEAKKRLDDCDYPDGDPRREDLARKWNELDAESLSLLKKFQEYEHKVVLNRMEERLSYAAKYSKTEPISGFGVRGDGYYMQLTADAINELADRGGYEFYLASEEQNCLYED